MSIQLIISGNHITDVLAQVQQLAEVTGAVSPKNEAGVTKQPTASTTSAPSKQAATSTEAPATGGKTETKKTLSREEQDTAVEEMIKAGAKDERFDLLTKGRQTAVTTGIADKSEKKDEANLDDMFGDDAAPAAEVTADTIRTMMGTLGKDAEGNPIQENLLKIRDILTKFVTKGKEIKVGNIPAEKLAAVHAELKKLEA